jgi:hypothetical protein
MGFVVLLVVVVAAAAGWWWRRRTADVVAEVDRFATARAMTSKWAADPGSGRAPMQDIAERTSAPESAPESDEPLPAAAAAATAEPESPPRA